MAGSGSVWRVSSSNWHPYNLVFQSREVELAGHLALECCLIQFRQIGGYCVLFQQLQRNTQVVIAGRFPVAIFVFATVLNAVADGADN